MRKMAVVLACVLSIGAISQVSFADDAPAPNAASTSSLTPEEAARLREEVRRLANLLGVKSDASSGTATDSTKGNKKPQDDAEVTMAKVADKTLQVITSGLSVVVAQLEKVAPKVWAIMIRQQYAKAFGDLALPLGLFVFAGIFLLVARSKIEHKIGECRYQGDCGACWGKGICYVVCTAVLTIMGVWFFIALSDSIKYLVNPEFYAIRDLLLLVLNKGQGVQ